MWRWRAGCAWLCCCYCRAVGHAQHRHLRSPTSGASNFSDPAQPDTPLDIDQTLSGDAFGKASRKRLAFSRRVVVRELKATSRHAGLAEAVSYALSRLGHLPAFFRASAADLGAIPVPPGLTLFRLDVVFVASRHPFRIVVLQDVAELLCGRAYRP